MDKNVYCIDITKQFCFVALNFAEAFKFAFKYAFFDKISHGNEWRSMLTIYEIVQIHGTIFFF